MNRFLAKLSTREKIFLLAGGGICALIFLFIFLINPLWERTEQLSRLMPQKEKELEQFRRLAEEYFFLSGQMKEVEARLPQRNQFSPLSYLEEIAKKNEVRGNIAYIRSVPAIFQKPYQEVPVEVKLENIPLARTVPFIDAIEHAPYFLRIKRLNLRTRLSDPKNLDITFVVSSYEKM
ncbi:MAG: type II secretion system protein M [Nitrospirae bacterium]|nr:type II secretion system protein M [Candidatus Troglogloeales bacterium]MBI3598987.1 type II secretion system protein M [Candidatus Troglogloeales bacterium]